MKPIQLSVPPSPIKSVDIPPSTFIGTTNEQLVPPPPEPELPTTYEGYVDLAKQVGRQSGPLQQKAMLWAALAQAEATNRLADGLEELLGFLNPADDGDGEDSNMPSELAAAIADGILMAQAEAEKPSRK